MLKPVRRETLLIVSAIGKEPQGLTNKLVDIISNARCAVIDCRMSILGEEAASYMLVAGTWDAVSKLENILRALDQHQISISLTRTPSRPLRSGIPYTVNLVSADTTAALRDVLAFFHAHQIPIDDLQSSTFMPSQSDTPVLTLNMVIRVPAQVHLPSLREEFMMLGDERNFDAVIEPLRTP